MFLKTLKSALALFAVLSSAVALADTGLYVGAQGGYADIRHENFDDDVNYSAYVGYEFVQSISVELAYGHLGEFQVDGSSNSIELSDAAHFAVVFSGPFIKNVSTEMTVKLGAYSMEVTPNITNGLSKSFDEKGFTVAYGLAQPIGEHFAVTFNWQYYRAVEDVNLSTYSLGLRANF